MDIEASDSGSYSCEASNGIGDPLRSIFRLVVPGKTNFFNASLPRGPHETYIPSLRLYAISQDDQSNRLQKRVFLRNFVTRNFVLVMV